MKTIAIILALVTIAVAERMTASLTLQSGASATKGSVQFIQNDRDALVHVIGNITNLENGKYFAFVHKVTNETNDCNALGPVETKDGDRLFLVFTLEVLGLGKKFQTASIGFTLFPKQPDSILNRSIALYDSQTMRLAINGPNSPLACGVVHPTLDEESASRDDPTSATTGLGDANSHLITHGTM